MENAVTQKTRSALLNLRKIAPKMAFVFDETGVLYERSIREIPIGSHILIKAGEIVPLDGVVIQGSSFVNLSHLTGESRPVAKRIGDEMPAGSLNLEGTLTLKVTRTSRDSTLSRIIELITSAQSAKPTLERFLDRFGKWYALTIIALFFLFALLLPWIFSMPYLGPEGSIYRALTFLIAASPCALIIATPTAYLSSISSCAKKGIMLKGGVILDALSRCSIIAFDKTGTLTTGQLACTDLQSFSEFPPICSLQKALAIAAGLEIADAISSYAQKEGISPLEIEHFQSKAGYGLEGIVSLDGEKVPVFIGHPDYIEQKISPELKDTWRLLKNKINEFKNPSTLLLIKESIYAFHFKDEIRSECFSTLPKLKFNQGFRLMMITGDHTDHARQVADELSLCQFAPRRKVE
jgi:cation transport ATPase